MLLILESATDMIRLLSGNKIYFRDNTAYVVTLFHFILLDFILESSLAMTFPPLGVSFLLSPTSVANTAGVGLQRIHLRSASGFIN
jgi:hypothetical protein